MLETLPRAFALAPVRPRLRESPEDFRVEEIALAQPVGNGQHVWLQIEKRGCNTEWVARQLASLAGVSGRDVGFAGMKDRNAVATQWFSVDLKGGAEPDWDRLDDALTLRACVRHRGGWRTRPRHHSPPVDWPGRGQRVGLAPPPFHTPEQRRHGESLRTTVRPHPLKSI